MSLSNISHFDIEFRTKILFSSKNYSNKLEKFIHRRFNLNLSTYKLEEFISPLPIGIWWGKQKCDSHSDW